VNPRADDWLPAVYEELRRVARARLAREAPGHTLQATALVHEAWLRLAGSSAEWHDRGHFLRTAARAMRRILVDRARARLAARREGAHSRVPLDPALDLAIAAPLPSARLVDLDENLSRLASRKPDHARLVELRFFAGATGDEAAEALGVSPATADRMWRYARAWLRAEIDQDAGGGS
jgi:RNA polymerase sigma factor (TIGR02999 family)